MEKTMKYFGLQWFVFEDFYTGLGRHMSARSKVFGGWLIKSIIPDHKETICFMPDPNHSWVPVIVNYEENKNV